MKSTAWIRIEEFGDDQTKSKSSGKERIQYHTYKSCDTMAAVHSYKCTREFKFFYSDEANIRPTVSDGLER